MVAATFNQVESGRALLDAGADVTKGGDQKDWTALHYACELGRKEMAQLLV